MSNYLQNFNSLYVNLAQSAYLDAPKEFPFEKLDPIRRSVLNSGQSVPFDFSKGTDYKGQFIPGGKNLGDDAVVYLQPDPTHTATKMTTVTVPKANGGYEDQTHVTGPLPKAVADG